MIMDMMRSCYQSSMRLYKDRPDVLTPGRWYFCAPGARVIPFRHSFGSMNWDGKGEDRDPEVGEVRPRGKWCNGRADVAYDGQHYCGSADVWLNGISYADRPGLEVNEDGIPLCCHPRVRFIGDLAIDGMSAQGAGSFGGELCIGGGIGQEDSAAHLGLEGNWQIPTAQDSFTGEISVAGDWRFATEDDRFEGFLAIEGGTPETDVTVFETEQVLPSGIGDTTIVFEGCEPDASPLWDPGTPWQVVVGAAGTNSFTAIIHMGDEDPVGSITYKPQLWINGSLAVEGGEATFDEWPVGAAFVAGDVAVELGDLCQLRFHVTASSTSVSIQVTWVMVRTG